MLEAIIFDLDGTLIDTEKNAVVAVEASFSRWGIALDPKDATYVTGRTWEKAFEFLFAKYRLPIPSAQAALEIKTEYTRSLHNRLDVVPGGAQAVTNLAQGHRIGLVSGSSRADILWALEEMGIKNQFKAILGAEDYPRSKPEPDGYLKAMKMLNAAPENTLIFEDSTAGIASALASGAWVAAITSTNHFAQDTSGAHDRIPDLTRVDQKWVADFMRRHQK